MERRDTSREIAPEVAHTLILPGLDLVLIQVEVEAHAETADITEEAAAEEMTEEMVVVVIVMIAEDAEEVQVSAAETQEVQVQTGTAEEEGVDQEASAAREVQEVVQLILGTRDAAREEVQAVIINLSPHLVIAADTDQTAGMTPRTERGHNYLHLRSIMEGASKRRAQPLTELKMQRFSSQI